MASAGTVPALTNSRPAVAKLIAAARMRNGAKWFYWIAALSLINSAVVIFGGNLHFVVGLGITEVVDALAKKAGAAGTVLDLVINGFVAGIFFLFGNFAGKAQKWAFVIGMAVYTLDAFLLFAAKDILSVAFHAYVLFAIYRGLAAANQLSSMEPTGAITGEPITP